LGEVSVPFDDPTSDFQSSWTADSTTEPDSFYYTNEEYQDHGDPSQYWEEYYDDGAQAKYWFNTWTGEATWLSPFEASSVS
jgi:hypothetical protein